MATVTDQTAFTPGPWRVEDDIWCVCSASAGDDGDIICDAPAEDAPESRAKWPANSALIASAPDLYEALKAMVDEQVEYMTLNHLGDPEKQHNIIRARSALSRATSPKE